MKIAAHLSIAERIPLWKQRSTTNERGCWLFQGCLDDDGYANVTYRRKNARLHKLVWEHFNGPTPQGKELDHLCRNRNCWNPGTDHLEPVTSQENSQRGETGKHFGERTHCPQGHEYTSQNTIVRKRGWRRCKQCHRDEENRRREAKRSRSDGTQKRHDAQI